MDSRRPSLSGTHDHLPPSTGGLVSLRARLGLASASLGTFNEAPRHDLVVFRQRSARYMRRTAPHGGTWTSVPNTKDVIALAQADFSGIDGPGRSIYALINTYNRNNFPVYRLEGSSWVAPGWVDTGVFGPTVVGGLAILAHEDVHGPVCLIAGDHEQGVRAWRGVGNWTQYAPFTRSGGQITRLRTLDDGSGPTVFAMGSIQDSSRNLRYLIKLVDGVWTQYDLPAEAIAAGDVTGEPNSMAPQKSSVMQPARRSPVGPPVHAASVA